VEGAEGGACDHAVGDHEWVQREEEDGVDGLDEESGVVEGADGEGGETGLEWLVGSFGILGVGGYAPLLCGNDGKIWYYKAKRLSMK